MTSVEVEQDELGKRLTAMGDVELAEFCLGLTEEELEVVNEALVRPELELAIGQDPDLDWRQNPATMAHYLTNGHLRLWAYVILLGEKFRDAVTGVSTRQIWNLPPRYGKSMYASQWGPAWALDRDPTSRIILVSYGDQLALENASAVRDILREHRKQLRVQLRQDRQQASRFVTTAGGGLLAAGIRSGITGFGADGAVFDDPFKNWQEAHSAAMRQSIDNAFRSVVASRLESEQAWVIIPMCMTGDTPVLRPSGSTTPLRDIRPGDEIATYEKGAVTTARVVNWANQGPDTVFRVRMKSGREVRANARHPFRVIREDGSATWVRVGSLRAGMRVRSVEAPIPAWSAPSRIVQQPLGARACACPTTTRPVTQPVTGHPHTAPLIGAPSGSRAAMGLPSQTTTGSSLSRTGGVPSAEPVLTRSGALSIGPTFSASTTTTKPVPYGVCSVTTATLSSPEPTPFASLRRPSHTWRIGTDEVVEVVEAGAEDVYDVEVERSHNFFANGLEVSNTRWHEDDLSGRLIKRMENNTGEDWEVVRIPELAEVADPKATDLVLRIEDLLGRKPGQVLEPKRFGLASIKRKHLAMGSYLTASMFQQRPSPEEGGEIKRAWWRQETSMPPKFDQAITSWDMKLKDSESGDFVVGAYWGRTGKDFWFADMLRGQWNQATTENAIALFSIRHKDARTHYIENTGNGPEVMAALRSSHRDYNVSDDVAGQLGMTDEERIKVSALRRRGMNGILPVVVKGSKTVRMRAESSLIEAGDVHVPADADWLGIMLDETASFPNGAHDDIVDTISQALMKLRAGQAGVYSSAHASTGSTPIATRGPGTRQPLPISNRGGPVQSGGRVVIPRNFGTGR